MSRTIITLIFCLISIKLLSQNKKVVERGKIDSIFTAEMSRTDFKDTNMVYMFALKVKVAKSKKGKTKILSINASDSSAYRIYKDLKFLNKINYNIFMGRMDTAAFIFPICIFLEYPGKKNAGFINMQELQKKMELLWFDKHLLDPIDRYIYIPALNIRTSTIESI